MATFKKSEAASGAKEKDPELLALGAHVRKLRTDSSLTQELLARRAGLHWTYVSQVERGTRNMSYKSLRKLAKGLDIKPSRIMPDKP